MKNTQNIQNIYEACEALKKAYEVSLDLKYDLVQGIEFDNIITPFLGYNISEKYAKKYRKQLINDLQNIVNFLEELKI